MIDNELLKKLDSSAYNHPEIIPADIIRPDKANYRIYFRFMACLYMMHNTGMLSVDDLKNIKREFMKDFEVYTLHFNAARQGADEFRRLDEAIIACSKNKDNCECCRNIYETRLKE